MLQLRWQRQW